MSDKKPLVVAHDLAKTFDVSAPWLNRVIERKPRQMLKPTRARVLPRSISKLTPSTALSIKSPWSSRTTWPKPLMSRPRGSTA